MFVLMMGVLYVGYVVLVELVCVLGIRVIVLIFVNLK